MPPETFYSIVGSNISRLRQEKHFTQEKLANAVHLDRTSISNIEQGRQKVLLHSLYEIAGALGIDPLELLPKKNILIKTKTEFSIPKNISSNEKIWLNNLIIKNKTNE